MDNVWYEEVWVNILWSQGSRSPSPLHTSRALNTLQKEFLAETGHDYVDLDNEWGKALLREIDRGMGYGYVEWYWCADN